MVTKKIKRRRLKKWVKYLLCFLVILVVFLLISLFKNINSVKSINENALKYKNGKCIAFYPNGNRKNNFVKDICSNYEGEEKIVYDYEVINQGDYYRISYGDLGSYYVDKDFNDIKFVELNEDGKHIISDYLRYTAKKDKPELYYNADFLDASFYENINIDNIEFEIVNEDLRCIFKDYELETYIPIKYLQNALNMNLGFDNDDYIKPKYLDLNKPMLALTFDDGPYSKVGQGIIDTLYRYDAVGTFYIVGSRLSEKELDYIKNSISLGNEYGSHSSDHLHFHKLSLAEATYQIKDTVDFVNNKIGYQMKTYRSPYGEHRDDVSENLGMVDILWNVDSYDWRSRDAAAVLNIIESSADNNDIILMHEIHPSTAEAVKSVVPYLINKGYQLVTVSELMEALNINPNNTLSFGGR